MSNLRIAEPLRVIALVAYATHFPGTLELICGKHFTH
jgi:hypothetical protein